MIDLHVDRDLSRTSSKMDADELLRNLGRFPSPVLPIGVLRELQSRGATIHDSLVTLIGKAIASVDGGLGSESNSVFFAFALLVPIATKDDQPLIESLLTLPDKSIDLLIGDLVSEAMPKLVARFFRDQSASEVIGWIDRLADHPNLNKLNAFPLFRCMRLAVAMGDLDRNTAIDALMYRLNKRADRRFDYQSAQVVCELIDLSARNLEAVDAAVRSSFGRDQIATNYVGIDSWDDSNSTSRSRGVEEEWIDPAADLSTWCCDFFSDDLDPVDATYHMNEARSRWSHLKESSVAAFVDQLRQSSDSHFPRNAVESLDLAFADAYQATIALIRDELVRYQTDSDSWSGNGAYLGLVLTIGNQMPLPPDLLESILRMTQMDREQVFGDQFGLIVQTVALTPLQQYDFVEQWIWDADRGSADRREMVDFYLYACHNNQLDRKLAIEALAAGLRRALFEEPILIAPYAENLAFLSPKEDAQLLDEAYEQNDIEWSFPLKGLRRMAQDAEYAKGQFQEHSQSYRSVFQMITEGVMFDRNVLEQKTLKMPSPARDLQPQPVALSATTIRSEDRTPRNAECPCGSGKKYKKCCLNK